MTWCGDVIKTKSRWRETGGVGCTSTESAHRATSNAGLHTRARGTATPAVMGRCLTGLERPLLLEHHVSEYQDVSGIIRRCESTRVSTTCTGETCRGQGFARHEIVGGGSYYLAGYSIECGFGPLEEPLHRVFGPLLF